MNLLTLPFRLPLMPLQGVIKLGERLQEQAERELRGPASVRRQLEQAEQAQASGEASEEEVARAQDQAVGRLLSSPENAPTNAPTAPAQAPSTRRSQGRRAGGGRRHEC